MLFALLNHQHTLDSLDGEGFDLLQQIGIRLNELLEVVFTKSGKKFSI